MTTTIPSLPVAGRDSRERVPGQLPDGRRAAHHCSAPLPGGYSYRWVRGGVTLTGEHRRRIELEDKAKGRKGRRVGFGDRIFAALAVLSRSF